MSWQGETSIEEEWRNTKYQILSVEKLAVGVRVGQWRPCDIKRAAAAAAAAIVCDDGTMIGR
jgi:hypothetical protein